MWCSPCVPSFGSFPFYPFPVRSLIFTPIYLISTLKSLTTIFYVFYRMHGTQMGVGMGVGVGLGPLGGVEELLASYTLYEGDV